MSSPGGIRAGKAFVEFGLDMSPLLKGLEQIKAKLNNTGALFTQLGAGLAGAGTAMLAPLTALLTGAAEHSRDIGSLATQFSTTTQTMSGLAAGFESIGVGFDSFTGLLDSLSNKMLNNDVLLQQLTGNVYRLARIPLPQALGEIADAFAQMTNSQQKAQLAQELFGSSWRRILPYLEQGKAGIDKLTEAGSRFTIDPERVAKGEATMAGFSAILTELKFTLLDVGAAILPTTQAIGGIVDWIKTAGSQVRSWISDNKELIAITALVGGGLLAAGTALTLFGGAAFGAAAIVGGIVIAFKALAAVVALVASPLGLVTAAVGGLGYLFVTQTEVGKGMFNDLKAGFVDLAETGKEAWGGMSDAFKKGDLAGAANIAFLGISVYWRKFVLGITQGWNAFKDFFVDGWTDLSASIGKLMIDLGAFILRNLLSPLQKVLGTVADVVDIADSESASKIRGALGGGMSDEEINRARDEAKKDIDAGRDAKKREGAAARADSEREARSDLAKIVDELHAAVEAVKPGGEAPFFGGGDFGGDMDKRRSDIMGLGTSVKGGFTATAAAQQFGVGDKTDRMIEGINTVGQKIDNQTEATKDLGVAIMRSMRIW